MKNKNIIKTITIDIAGTEVEVTPEQAKNLQEALTELLGLNKPTKVIEKEVVRDRYYPTPYWPYRQITWSGSGTAQNPEINKWTVSYAAPNANAMVKIS